MCTVHSWSLSRHDCPRPIQSAADWAHLEEMHQYLSTQSARTIIVNDARSDPPDATDDTSADEPTEEEVALPQRSAWRKRPAPGCYLCDHQITAKCNRIERPNKQPATSGKPISLCHSKRQRVACCICRQNSGDCVKRYPLTPTTLSLSSNHVFFLAGRWSTSGWGGNAHFLPPHKNTIEGDRRK